MQEKSIDNALLALRKSLIRNGGEGLDHVEAILRLRKVDMPKVLPAKRSDVARSGQMRRLVLGALRSGGLTFREIAAHVSLRRPELNRVQARKRVSPCLDRMNTLGLVVRHGKVWSVHGP